MMKLSSWIGGFAAALAIATAGCATVSPVAPSQPAAAAEPIQIGTDKTPTIDLVAALYVAALEADGQPAELVEVVPGTETLAVADHSPVAMPVFAGTLLQQYNKDPAASAADVIAGLATAVAPDLVVLETSEVDGGLVWAVTMQSASSGVGDLVAVGGWGADKVVAAPTFALSNPAGVPALSVAYGSNATIEEVDDPAARQAALADGSADAAGFRRTESVGLADFVALDDPMGVGAPDPLTVLLAADLAEERPGAVLVLDAVQQALTEESLAELTRAAAADGTDAAVTAWLTDAGLAG